MSSTILGGDFTVYYKAENGQKRIEYSGSGSTHTVRSMYSALQDLFDELNQMDDEVPMTAQTPTEFTLVNGWFIDDTSLEYLYGGAIQTNGWATNEIVQVQYTDTSGFTGTDIGKTVTTTSYSGTLLDYNDTGTTQYAWIRPDDPTTDDFDLAEAMAVTGGTATPGDVVVSTNLTGECLWPNVYTIGSIADNTTVYVVQDGGKLSSAKATTDWWNIGHIDILVKTKNMGQEIDDGVVKVYVRKFGALYDNFEVDLTNGGRNPIPLATAADLNNANGYRQMVLTDASDNFTVGEIIEDDSEDTIQGIITSSTGTLPNITIQYYLIGDPLSDFTGATGTFTGQTSAETATAVAPTDVGPADLTADPTFTFTATDEDLNNGSGSRPYSIAIDCQGETLATVYEFFKYINRRGSTVDLDGTDGEQYIGSQAQVEYDTETGGDMAEGDTVYLFEADNTLAAQGVIVADHEVDGDTGDFILRQTRYFTSGTITKFGDDPAWGSVTVSGTVSSVRTINPTKQSPLGTFAGGTMFAAPGVWLSNMAADQKYQLIDDEGAVQVPPTTVSVKISNTRALDALGIFRLDGSGNIDKAEYTLADSQTLGATTLAVTTAISSEAPKTGASYGTGGIVRVIDANAAAAPEYRLRYTTYTGSTFTLFTRASTANDTATPTVINDADGNFVVNGVRKGDLVYNSTRALFGYVSAVAATQLTLVGVGIAGQTDGDSYEIGTLPFTTGTGQGHTGYVPFLDLVESTGTSGSPGEEYSSIIYSSAIDVRVRVRQAGDILPYEADNQIGANGLTAPTIRNPDTIYQ